MRKSINMSFPSKEGWTHKKTLNVIFSLLMPVCFNAFFIFKCKLFKAQACPLSCFWKDRAVEDRCNGGDGQLWWLLLSDTLLTNSAVSLLTWRLSLLSSPLIFSVAPSLGSNITQPVILLFAPELREKKNHRLAGSGRWRRTESCLDGAGLMMESRAYKLLQVVDRWFKKYAPDTWHRTSKQDCMHVADFVNYSHFSCKIYIIIIM